MGSGPQFGETVYISEVDGARKVKYNAQVAMNKNAEPVQIFSSGLAGKTVAQIKFFQTF